jgi:glycosyltransferase involved in cell wall biosynthesis
VKHQSWNTFQTYANHLGVDAGQFTPPKSTPSGNRIIVGIVGRIAPEKLPMYFFDFIDKFNQNAANFYGFEFRFFGKGLEGSEFLSSFKTRIKGIKNARYMGEVEKSLIQRVYHSLDILIVPSLSETGSYAIVEAQLCGLRVLALDADGIPNHMNGTSTLCINYDMIFDNLAKYRTRDGIVVRRKQAHLTAFRHSLTSWVGKLDKLAEIANS